MIFYKSDKKSAPAWMAKPIQRDYTHFYVYADREPMAWPKPDVEWIDLPGTPGIAYFLIGDPVIVPRETFEDIDGVKMVKTPCGSCVPVFPAIDKTGKAWPVPVIVDGDGPRLSLDWATDANGAIVRQASKEQQRIIDTCTELRKAIFSEGGLADLPLEQSAQAAGLIMSYSHHLHPSEFLIHGLLNDFLVPRILLAATGCGTPEHELASRTHG